MSREIQGNLGQKAGSQVYGLWFVVIIARSASAVNLVMPEA